MNRKHAICAAAVLLAVCLTYANSFHNGFHFDDFHTIVDNPSIRSLANVPRFFRDAGTFSVLPANRTYRPLVSTSLALDYALGHGYDPLMFHADMFAFFLLLLGAMAVFFNSLLQTIRCDADTTLVALVAVAWYGLHPAMAETVNYLIQRGDLFSTLGVVAALATYVRWPSFRRTGLYLVPLALGLLSKPPALVFPVLLGAYLFYFEPQSVRRVRSAMVAILPSLALCVALMTLQAVMTPKTFVPSTVSGLDYRMTQPFVLLRYFTAFFLPLHLNVDTDLQAFASLTPDALLGFLFLAFLVAVIVWTARRLELRPISYGLLWFAIASIPTSVYRLAEVENDHRMFMPFVGLALAATWTVFLIVERLAARRPELPVRRLAAGLAVFVLAAYAYGAHVRNRVWRTEETLWLDDVAKSPHNGRGLMIYGLTEMARGAYPSALDYFERALLYTPNYPTLEINLGVVHGAMHHDIEATQHFERAIALAPNDDETHFYYGRWLFEIGRIDDALVQLQTAVRLNPSRLAGRDLLLQVLALDGQSAEAVTLARQTLAFAPSDAAAQNFLAHPPAPTAAFWINASLDRYQKHDFNGAIEAALQALRLDPSSEIAYNNLGAAYAGLGQWKPAIEAEKKALALKPDFQLAKNNLAWAIAEARKTQGVKGQ